MHVLDLFNELAIFSALSITQKIPQFKNKHTTQILLAHLRFFLSINGRRSPKTLKTQGCGFASMRSIQPGWIPWRGFIGPTFMRSGTIGSRRDLRPKLLLKQSPVCLRAGPYEAPERNSPRFRVKRKKRVGKTDSSIDIMSSFPYVYFRNNFDFLRRVRLWNKIGRRNKRKFGKWN